MSAGILGGDTLVQIIATNPTITERISKTVFLTDVDGVFTKDPKSFSDATLIRNIFIDPLSGKVMNEVSASGSSHEHDVTGGLEVCTI
jgi:isopentenyl phosphate kinase